MTTENSPQLARLPAVQKQLGGISRVTIWRMCRRKDFPAPITVGKNCMAWLQSDIDQWIARRAESRVDDITAKEAA